MQMCWGCFAGPPKKRQLEVANGRSGRGYEKSLLEMLYIIKMPSNPCTPSTLGGGGGEGGFNRIIKPGEHGGSCGHLGILKFSHYIPFGGTEKAQRIVGSRE